MKRLDSHFRGNDKRTIFQDFCKSLNRQLFEEVRQELVELNEFVEREHSSNLNLLMGGLTILASVGLILTVWVGFFGINIPPVSGERLSEFGWSLLLIGILFSLFLITILVGKIGKLNIRRWIFNRIEDFVRCLK